MRYLKVGDRVTVVDVIPWLWSDPALDQAERSYFRQFLGKAGTVTALDDWEYPVTVEIDGKGPQRFRYRELMYED